MDKEELKQRTKDFALRILKLADALPKTSVGRMIKGQIIRCGTSVASNYRASCRARSKLEFISKLGIAEEADESAFWMEIIIERKMLRNELVEPLLHEAYELVAIIVSSRKTSRRNI